jgi:thioredoxin 1
MFTDDTWDEVVLSSKGVVVVEFWAEWCAPCRMMAETITRLGSDFDGRARIGKLNVDENERTTERYDIRGIPAILLFKDGELKEEVIGVTSKDYVAKLIEKHLETV